MIIIYLFHEYSFLFSISFLWNIITYYSNWKHLVRKANWNNWKHNFTTAHLPRPVQPYSTHFFPTRSKKGKFLGLMPEERVSLEARAATCGILGNGRWRQSWHPLETKCGWHSTLYLTEHGGDTRPLPGQMCTAIMSFVFSLLLRGMWLLCPVHIVGVGGDSSGICVILVTYIRSPRRKKK